MSKPDLKSYYKYDPEEVEKFHRNARVDLGGRLTSQVDPHQNMFKYFYPNRLEVDKRYEKERIKAELEKAKAEIRDAEAKEAKLLISKAEESTKSDKSKKEDIFLKQRWQSMKMTKPLCDDHQQPVTKFSYPFIQFWCRDCYEELPDNSNVYSMDELHLPVERLYASLLQYIDGGKMPMLEKYHTEYEVEFEQYLEDRQKYCLQGEIEEFK